MTGYFPSSSVYTKHQVCWSQIRVIFASPSKLLSPWSGTTWKFVIFCLTITLGAYNDQVSLENTSLNHNSVTPSHRHGGWACLTSTSIWLPAVSVEMTNPIRARMRWAGGYSLLCMWAPQRIQSQYSGANGTAGTGVQGPGLYLWSPSMLPPGLG